MATAARSIRRSRCSAKKACRCRLASTPRATRTGASTSAEVFPVLIWIIGAHWHANLWFWPVSEDKTDVRVEFFAYKAETVGDALAHAYFRARLREVFREDVGIMEQITNALKAGAMQNIVLSKQEFLLQKHYAVANEMVGRQGGSR